MTRGPEGRVQDYCRDYFKQRGWLALKQDSGGGVPDFLMVSPKGFHLWVEFKRPGKHSLDVQQEKWRLGMERRLPAEYSMAAVEGPVNSRDEVRDLYAMYVDA